MNTIGTVIKDVLSDRKKLWLRGAIGVFLVMIATALPLPQAKTAFDNQQAVFVDVRSVESYNVAKNLL